MSCVESSPTHVFARTQNGQHQRCRPGWRPSACHSQTRLGQSRLRAHTGRCFCPFPPRSGRRASLDLQAVPSRFFCLCARHVLCACLTHPLICHILRIGLPLQLSHTFAQSLSLSQPKTLLRHPRHISGLCIVTRRRVPGSLNSRNLVACGSIHRHDSSVPSSSLITSNRYFRSIESNRPPKHSRARRYGGLDK